MYVSYEKAKKIVNENKVSSIKDYRSFYDKKVGLPMYLERNYGKSLHDIIKEVLVKEN